MNISLQEKRICNDIDKLIGRISTLQKKKKLWGLNVEEDKKLIGLTVDYLKNYYQLIDIVFNNYIEPFMYNDNIIDIKEELYSKYNWDGSVTMFNDDIDELLNNCKDSIPDVLNLIEQLKDEELLAADEFINTEYGKEAIEMFCSLQNVEINDECIRKYILVRYEVILGLLETGDDDLWQD